MDDDPSYFFKYVWWFGKKEGSIPSLKGPNGLVADGKSKAKILHNQYSSVWPVPVVKLSDSVVCNLYKECADCNLEAVHICKEDIILEAIYSHREAIME